MHRRGSLSNEAELVSFIIRKAKEAEAANPYDARSWLLTGKSVATQNYSLHVRFTIHKDQLVIITIVIVRFSTHCQVCSRKLF